MRKLVSYLLTLTITTNERKLTFKTSSFVGFITLSSQGRRIQKQNSLKLMQL